MMAGGEIKAGHRRISDKWRPRRGARTKVAPRFHELRASEARAYAKGGGKDGFDPRGRDLTPMPHVLHRRPTDDATVSARNDVRVIPIEDGAHLRRALLEHHELSANRTNAR